jgi:hypothetical protein
MTTQAELSSAQATAFVASSGTGQGTAVGGAITVYTFTITW